MELNLFCLIIDKWEGKPMFGIAILEIDFDADSKTYGALFEFYIDAGGYQFDIFFIRLWKSLWKRFKVWKASKTLKNI